MLFELFLIALVCTIFLWCAPTFFVLVIVLYFAPSFPPYIDILDYIIEPAETIEPKNNDLDKGEHLHQGILQGPESIAIKNENEIFLSCLYGNILKLWGKNLENITVIHKGKNGSFLDVPVSERPLGMRYIPDDKLLVADAYKGIYILDTITGDKEIIVDGSEEICGKKAMFFNDLDIDEDGNIYWSDSSHSFHVNSIMLGILAGPSGRLFKYNAKTKKNELLLDNLNFSNGVQLSPKGEFVLVAETLGRRVQKYWLKGSKCGSSETFLSNLPGIPDNIRPIPGGGYFIPIDHIVEGSKTDLLKVLSEFKLVRRLISRMLYCVQGAFKILNYLLPNAYFKAIEYYAYRPLDIGNENSIILKVNEDGKIIDSLHGTKGIIKVVSEVQQVGDYLLFGSYKMSYLGRLKLSSNEE